MIRLVDAYFRFLKFLTVVFLATMVALVFGNVVLRYGFNSGIAVSEELSRWLFVWLVFLGAAVAVKEHVHLGMDSLVARLPPLGKKICFVASHVLMLYCVYLFFVGTWAQTVLNVDVAAPATGLSSGFFYGIGLVFCVTSFAVLVFNLYQMLRGRLTEEELIQVKESEDTGEVEELPHEPDRQRAQQSSTKNR